MVLFLVGPVFTITAVCLVVWPTKYNPHFPGGIVPFGS
jgi:hypothetical protein